MTDADVAAAAQDVVGDCGHLVPRGARLWAVTRWQPAAHRFVPQRVCYGCMMQVPPDSLRGPVTYAPQRLRPLRIGQAR